jgi:5-methylthioadenosine/S-adenosylhomocysteine deaminase
MTERLGHGALPAGQSGGTLVVHGLTIWSGAGDVVLDGALAIDGGRLADVGPTATVLQRYGAARRMDGTGHVAMPGLVNAHTHAAMGFFRGLGHGRAEMIETFLFPAEKRLTRELLAPLSYSYLVAGLKAGVTCFGDHYYFVDGVAWALDRLGLRGVVGEAVADLGGAFPGREGFDRWRAAVDAWPHSHLITPAVAPHAADTVSAPLLKELAAFAKARKLPLHMHLSQTTGERQRVQAREGCSPVAAAERAGALTPATLAVHLVTADKDDIGILKRSGATAGICPASQIIYERLAPLAELAAAGVPIAIGTDCAASNDGADLLGELRLTALLAQDRGLAEGARSPAAILRMGTVNGAKVLGLGDRVGRLAPGLAADVVFLADDLSTQPAPLPEVNLLFSMNARHVRHVMIDGRFVLYQGALTLADEDDLKAEYLAAAREIKRRIGL